MTKVSFKIFIWIFPFLSLSAWAYVPPSQFILGTWSSKHSVGSKWVKLRNTVTAFEKGKASSVYFRETVIYNPNTGILKSIATDDADQKLFSIEKTIDSLPPISKLLMSSDITKNTDALKSQGIPIRSKEELLALPTEVERLQTEKVALKRVQGQLATLAWVISAPQGEDESKTPQIWFEKDTFFPIRLVTQEARDQIFYNFQLEDFRFFHEFTYPKTIQVKPLSSKDSEVIFSSQLIDLFILNSDHPGLKPFFSSTANGYSDLGLSSSGALKNLIMQYYGIVR